MNTRPEYAGQAAIEIAGAPDTRREGIVTWLRDLGAG
jgi:hypothetical protein